MGWAERIRAGVEADGRGLWPLSRSAGIDYPNLSRFMAGKAGLSLASAERLAGLVGLDLTETGTTNLSTGTADPLPTIKPPERAERPIPTQQVVPAIKRPPKRLDRIAWKKLTGAERLSHDKAYETETERAKRKAEGWYD